MRTTLLSTALPNADSGSGASIILELIADSLRGRGHDVSLCAVVYPEYATPDGAGWELQLDHASALGIEVEPVLSEAWRPRAAGSDLRSRLTRIVRRDAHEIYPTLLDAPAVAAAVERLRPDAVLVYGFEALAASAKVGAPRFAATSDPPHVALRERARRRWRTERHPMRMAREALSLQSALRAHRQLALELLRECDAVGAFGRHHAEWLEKLGVRCDYYRTPIADPGPPGAEPANERPRLLLIGHLRGTATLDGLKVFEAMLPHLERELGRDGFEARIVGGYEPPPELGALLRHPSVQLAGFVDDVGAEFRAADVLLVPVSIRLGVRVRVLTGFAHGCCVVTHEANAAGIPELMHGGNALLGDGAEALAQAVVQAVRDRELAVRLRHGARATYERYFAPDVAGSVLAATLERIARAPASA
jgi:glycosyltransferase involved in cell wall biosynthesis